MQGKLDGKVIIIAGAGGIGDGIARRYAAEGATVLLGDIDEQAATIAAAQIVADGGKAIGLRLDGSDEASIAAAVDRAVAEFGGLDGFHANFASFKDGETGADVLGLPLDVYDQVMHVNARGFLLCARAAIPAMVKRGGGSIVFTSSGAAYLGEPVRVAYAMSKAAGHALARHIARRFGADGIRANVIAPGAITHPRFEAAIPPEIKDRMIRGTPAARLGTADDIAAMGALLMSDDGSYLTGQVLSVDGGATMRA